MNKVSPLFGCDSTDGCDRLSLRWKRACLHSSVHSKATSLCRSLKNGSACYTDFATKQGSEVSIPFRTCIDFFKLGLGSLENAWHLSGLALIPCSVR